MPTGECAIRSYLSYSTPTKGIWPTRCSWAFVFSGAARAKSRVRLARFLDRRDARRYNVCMFFRRQRPTQITFQERLDNLKRAGFSMTPRPDGSVLVGKAECAVSLH